MARLESGCLTMINNQLHRAQRILYNPAVQRLTFFRIKRNRIELSTGKIIEENLVPSAFQQTLGAKFTFQQENNPQQKATSTLEFLTKKTVNVPEGPSYSFDLNQLENLRQDLKIAV